MTDLKEYVQQIGMQIVLEELIDLCDGDEVYIQALKIDLEATLRNYMNRYDA